MPLGRQARDQELDLIVAGRLLDVVEVVEDENDVVRHGGERAHDGRQHGPWCRSVRATDDAGRLSHGKNAPGSLQGLGDVGPQPIGIVVTAVERDPGRRRPVPAVQPLRDERGLAVAGGSGHEGDRMADGQSHRIDQALSGDPVVAYRRRSELGLEERVDGGRGRDGMTERIHRLGHRGHLAHAVGGET
jgi:hypothetical protein